MDKNKLFNGLKRILKSRTFAFTLLCSLIVGMLYIPPKDQSKSINQREENSLSNKNNDNDSPNINGYSLKEIRENFVKGLNEQKKIGYVLDDFDMDLFYGTKTGKPFLVQATDSDGNPKFDESKIDSEGNFAKIYTYEKNTIYQWIKVENGTGELYFPGLLNQSYMNFHMPIKYDVNKSDDPLKPNFETLPVMHLDSKFYNNNLYFDFTSKDDELLQFKNASYTVNTNVGNGQIAVQDPDGETRYLDDPSELSGLFSNIINALLLYGDLKSNRNTRPQDLSEKNYNIDAQALFNAFFNMEVVRNRDGGAYYYLNLPLNRKPKPGKKTPPRLGVKFTSDARFNLREIEFPCYSNNDKNAPDVNDTNRFLFDAFGSNIQTRFRATFSPKDVTPIGPANPNSYRKLTNISSAMLGAYSFLKSPRLYTKGSFDIKHAINGPIYNGINVGSSKPLNLSTANSNTFETMWLDIEGATDHTNKLEDEIKGINPDSSVAKEEYLKLNIGTYSNQSDNFDLPLTDKFQDRITMHQLGYYWNMDENFNYLDYSVNFGNKLHSPLQKVIRTKVGYIDFNDKASDLRELIAPFIEKTNEVYEDQNPSKMGREEFFNMIAMLKNKGIGRTVYKLTDAFFNVKEDSDLTCLERGTFEGLFEGIESIEFDHNKLILTIDLKKYALNSGVVKFICSLKTEDQNDSYELKIVEPVQFGVLKINGSLLIERCKESSEDFRKTHIDPEVYNNLDKYTEFKNINSTWDHIVYMFDRKTIASETVASLMEDKTYSSTGRTPYNAGIEYKSRLSLDANQNKLANKAVITRNIPTIDTYGNRRGIRKQEYIVHADGLLEEKDYIDDNGKKVVNPVTGKTVKVINEKTSNLFFHVETKGVGEQVTKRSNRNYWGINGYINASAGKELLELFRAVLDFNDVYKDNRFSNLLKLFAGAAKVKEVGAEATFSERLIDGNELNALVSADILRKFERVNEESVTYLNLVFNKDILNLKEDIIVKLRFDNFLKYDAKGEVVRDKQGNPKKANSLSEVDIETRLPDYDLKKHGGVRPDGVTQFDAPKIKVAIKLLNYQRNQVDNCFYFRGTGSNQSLEPYNQNADPYNYGHDINAPIFTDFGQIADLTRFFLNSSVFGSGLKLDYDKYKVLKFLPINPKTFKEPGDATYRITMKMDKLKLAFFSINGFDMDTWVYLNGDKVRIIVIFNMGVYETLNFTSHHYYLPPTDEFIKNMLVYEKGFGVTDEEKELDDKNLGNFYLYRWATFPSNNNPFTDFRKVTGRDFLDNMLEWVEFYMMNDYSYKSRGEGLRNPLAAKDDIKENSSIYFEDILSEFKTVGNKTTIDLNIKPMLPHITKIKQSNYANIEIFNKYDYLYKINFNSIISYYVTIEARGHLELLNFKDGGDEPYNCWNDPNYRMGYIYGGRTRNDIANDYAEGLTKWIDDKNVSYTPTPYGYFDGYGNWVPEKANKATRDGKVYINKVQQDWLWTNRLYTW